MGHEREIVGARPKQKFGEITTNGKKTSAKFCLMCKHEQIHFYFCFVACSEKDMVRVAEDYLQRSNILRDDWKNFAIMHKEEDIFGGPIWVAWRRPW